MDGKLIIALIGIGGILIAAILSSAGYFYRSKLEGKKSARKVLYLLLEIRHAIIISSIDVDEAIDKYIDHYIKRLVDKGHSVEKSETEEAVSKYARSYFENIISSAGTDIKARILLPFETSLLEMASVNPVLAYKLRGKEKLEALISHTNEHQEIVSNEFISNIKEDWLKNVVLDVSLEVKDMALSELYEDLDNAVLLLAKNCGRSDYRKSKKSLATGLNNSNKYNFPELDKYIDTYMERVVEAASKQSPAVELS